MTRTEHPAMRAIQEIKKAVIGKDDCIVKVMTAILAGGHILIEDVPGGHGRSCDPGTSQTIYCDRYSESGGKRGNFHASGISAGSLYGMYEHGISRYGI